MRSIIFQILDLLPEGETASSYTPLLLVTSIFILVAAGMVYLILRLLRAPMEGPEGFSKKSRTPFKFNSAQKIRQFVKLRLIGTDNEIIRALTDESKRLRRELKRLTGENTHLTNLQTKAEKQAITLTSSLAQTESLAAQRQKELEEQRTLNHEKEQRLAEGDGKLKEASAELEQARLQNLAAVTHAGDARAAAEIKYNALENEITEFVAEIEQVFASSSRLSALRQGLTRSPNRFSQMLKLGDAPTEEDQNEERIKATDERIKSLVTELERTKQVMSESEMISSQQKEDLAKMRSVLLLAKEQILSLMTPSSASQNPPRLRIVAK